jgi:hypothetical protein
MRVRLILFELKPKGKWRRGKFNCSTNRIIRSGINALDLFKNIYDIILEEVVANGLPYVTKDEHDEDLYKCIHQRFCGGTEYPENGWSGDDVIDLLRFLMDRKLNDLEANRNSDVTILGDWSELIDLLIDIECSYKYRFTILIEDNVKQFFQRLLEHELELFENWEFSDRSISSNEWDRDIKNHAEKFLATISLLGWKLNDCNINDGLNVDLDGNSEGELNYYNKILEPFINEYNHCFGGLLEKIYPTQPKPILALEFEWVIAAAGKNHSVNELDFMPIKGSIEFCQEAVKYYDVCVYSNNKNRIWKIWRMQQWLRMNRFPYQIRLPLKKPNAFVTLDTNSIRFNGSSSAFKELGEAEWFKINSDEFENLTKYDSKYYGDFPLHLWYTDRYQKGQLADTKGHSSGDTQAGLTDTDMEDTPEIDADREQREMTGQDEDVVIKAIQDYLESRDEGWQEWTMREVTEERGWRWCDVKDEHERELEDWLPEDVNQERKNRERLLMWAKTVYECIDEGWRKNLRTQVEVYGEIDDLGV